ncbi:YeeE/YedE thiosulfate transporter family protein [Candidatus Pseudothioglobus singularis]|nr:YeeE/YedE thiosulfate transporter family protein [Candidatus Pseudothioglobus singularis]MDC6455948.1 YeeE/YedE thiosulfate transporter family protein [Candidatus Pseudothioglobus singularis]
MYNFTPVSALIGGLIIGLSVVLYFYATGRLAGISGIFENAITQTSQRVSNTLFLIGLVVGPLIIYNLVLPNNPIAFEITHSYLLIIPGGFLVGFGTRLGGGCTSGHGICGIGRLSVNSMVATATFVAIGVLTVFTLQQFGIYL